MKFKELKAKYISGKISKAEYISLANEIHQGLFEYVLISKSCDVSEICINKDGIIFTMSDYAIKMLAPPGEARVAPLEVMNFDKYEPEETRVMDLVSGKATTILDIGANIGWFSIRYSHKNPNAQIYAFEPLPESYSYLQKNVALNQVGNKVTTFNYGLSESSGTVEFYLASANGTNASMLNVAEAEEARAIAGLTITLDQWAANYGVSPDFIKCDVEGAELLVFRGGQHTLKTHFPVVFAELLRKWAKPFGYHPNDVLKFFENIGYKCFAIGKDRVSEITIVTDETVETNYVFLHSEKHISQIESVLEGWNE